METKIQEERAMMESLGDCPECGHDLPGVALCEDGNWRLFCTECRFQLYGETRYINAAWGLKVAHEQAAGVKHDNGKPPMSLLDRHALEEIAKVMGFGAQKYAAHNWRKGLAYSRLIDAAVRHLYAYADGEDNDAESGLSHAAHAGCCVMFLLGMAKHRPDLDDRWIVDARRLLDSMENAERATSGS